MYVNGSNFLKVLVVDMSSCLHHSEAVKVQSNMNCVHGAAINIFARSFHFSYCL